MADRVYTVLFLCTGNSARSIMAEALLNQRGRGTFRAYSAGSHPTGQVHPLALEVLQETGISTEGLRSKSWEELAAPSLLKLDFVLTVCDRAAGEACPVWPGQPVTAHWGVPDPAAVQEGPAAKKRAFVEAFLLLERRISLLLSLTPSGLDRISLRERLQTIGKT